jgi:putative sigma-54 modulation protein
MQQPVEIQFQGMDHSDALEARVRDEVEQLEEACPQLLSCRVFIKAAHHRKGAGDLYEVQVDMKVRGQEVAAGHQQDKADKHHEDAHDAVRHAFQLAEKRLRTFLDRRKDNRRRG